jgi:predicted metal-dependent hydrolase
MAQLVPHAALPEAPEVHPAHQAEHPAPRSLAARRHAGRRTPEAALEHLQLDLPLFGTAVPNLPANPPTAPAAPDLPRTASGIRERTLQLGARLLQYKLKRSARRTIGFSIDGNGLSVTAPRWVTLADIETAIGEKQKWIFAKLAEWQSRAEQRALPRIVWEDGASLPFIGKPIRIALESASGALEFNADTAVLAIGLPAHAQAEQIKDRVQGWLQNEAKRLFVERLDHYAARLEVSYTECALSSAATRWGSCSSEGKIRLNWRLIHFPLTIIDYVVAHELSHLREMNHSPRFWETVETVFPEFREARQTLRQHPPELLPIL